MKITPYPTPSPQSRTVAYELSRLRSIDGSTLRKLGFHDRQTLLKLRDALKSSIPARLELARHEAFSGIYGLITTRSERCFVLGFLQLVQQSLLDVVLCIRKAFLSEDGSLDCVIRDHFQKRASNGLIDTYAADAEAHPIADVFTDALIAVRMTCLGTVEDAPRLHAYEMSDGYVPNNDGRNTACGARLTDCEEH